MTTQRYAEQRQVLRVHACVFTGSILAVALVNVTLNAAAGILGEWWAWWSVLAALGWGLGLLIHGIVVRLARAGWHESSTIGPGCRHGAPGH